MPASTMTNTLWDAEMNYMFRGGTAPTVPAKYYIALFTSALSNLGTVPTEVSTSGTGYARVEVDADNTEWSDPTSGGANRTVSNINDITFGTPTANWGTITGLGIFTHATSTSINDLYFYGAMQVQKTVNNGDGAPKIPAGNLKISRATCP